MNKCSGIPGKIPHGCERKCTCWGKRGETGIPGKIPQECEGGGSLDGEWEEGIEFQKQGIFHSGV